MFRHLWTIVLKCFTPKAEYKPSNVHTVFDNYSDDQDYSVKETKKVGRGEGKRLYIGKDSQDMSQGEEYQNLLKNTLNKADLITRFNDYVQRELSFSQMDYPLIITEGKDTWEISNTGIKYLFSCNHEDEDTTSFVIVS